jgi:outer membrane protein TolC
VAAIVAQAEAGRRLAYQEYWPDFMLGVDYRFRKDITGDPVMGADFLTFKAGVSLPLWFFAKQKHQVRSADQAVLASREQQRSVRDTLVARYDDAVSHLSATLASLDTYDKSLIPEASAAVEAAEVAYEVGRVDFNAVLSAQSDAFEIKLERLDFLRQYHKTKTALAELAGVASER